MVGNAALLNPDSFVEGGGLIDDVDATFKSCTFEMFDYNGKADPAPALKLVLDVAGDEMTQYYSMGSAKDWIPSEDGKQLLSVGSATSIRLSSNGGIFLKSLVDSGFPGDKLGDDISILDGTQAHMIQVPEPQRSTKKTKEQQEKEAKYGPKTILVVSAINRLPWEKATPAGGKKAPATGKPVSKPAAKPAAKTETAEVSGGAVEDKVTEFILGVLAEAGTVMKKELPAKIFAALKDDPDKSAMVKVVFSDDFLNAGPWNYSDGVLVAN
jgi:hypothetical protein